MIPALLPLKQLRREDGNTIIEMAIGLSVFIGLMFGFIDFALIVFGICNAGFASRAAARYGSLHSTTSYRATTQTDLNAIVSPYIFPYPSNSWSVAYSFSQPYGNTITGTVNVAVTVKYTFQLPSLSNPGIRAYTIPITTNSSALIVQ